MNRYILEAIFYGIIAVGSIIGLIAFIIVQIIYPEFFTLLRVSGLGMIIFGVDALLIGFSIGFTIIFIYFIIKAKRSYYPVLG